TLQFPFDFSSLDFAPGSLLLLLAQGWKRNIAGVFDQTVALGDTGLTDWNPITSAGRSFGSVSDYRRIRAAWKIADGSENSVTPFTWSGTATSQGNSYAYEMLAFDVLGGTMRLHAAPSAAEGTAGAAIGTQTIKTGDHGAPALAV